MFSASLIERHRRVASFSSSSQQSYEPRGLTERVLVLERAVELNCVAAIGKSSENFLLAEDFVDFFQSSDQVFAHGFD